MASTFACAARRASFAAAITRSASSSGSSGSIAFGSMRSSLISPPALAGDTLTLEFPQTASFHLKLAEDPKNAAMLREALYEVTGRKLAVEFELGETAHERDVEDGPTSEEDVVELMKSTFDARELDE